MLHSRLLATFDKQIETMNFGDSHLEEGSSVRVGKTVMEAAVASGADGIARAAEKDMSSLLQMPSASSLLKSPAAASTGFASSQENAHLYANSETRRQISTAAQDTFQESSPQFPLYTYKSASPPPIRYYIRDDVEANRLVSQLRGPLGFDLEWRVIFGYTQMERKTAVLQLSDEHMILVLQLSAMKQFPQSVKEIMETQDVVKMGVNILNDGRKLRRDYGVMSAGLLEMSHLARLVDPSRVTSKRMISLQRIVEMYTGCTLNKGPVRMSNWEARLSEEQLEYAANDAHSALIVYLKLMGMAAAKDMVLRPVRVPDSSPMAITFVSESSVLFDRGNIPEIAPSPRAFSSKTSAPKPAGSTGDSVTRNRPRARSIFPAAKAANSKPVAGQLLRAYKLWHEEQLPLQDICNALRSSDNPLKKGTVIGYVVKALQTDSSLTFSRERLRALILLDFGASQRFGPWLARLDKTNRGLAT